MSELISAAGIAVVVFVTTNIDDILLLAAFFANPKLGARAVVVGQLLGMVVLTVASALAALLALAVPAGVTGLLGVVPLGLGLRQLWALRPARGAPGQGDDAEREQEDRLPATRSQALAIAGVTIANGGDNLGVYIPLFAREPAWIGLYALVFAALTLVWCALGHWLVNHSIVGARIRRFGHVALPFVLIALGLYILADALVLF
jgi:cadmium resistance protein CadD (predicted permease)